MADEKNNWELTVNSCMDGLFNPARDACLRLEYSKLSSIDRVTIAGGPLPLILGEEFEIKAYWLNMDVSFQSHVVEKYVLITHKGCGYVKLKGVKFHSESEELGWHINQLEKSGKKLLEKYGDSIEVRLMWEARDGDIYSLYEAGCITNGEVVVHGDENGDPFGRLRLICSINIEEM